MYSSECHIGIVLGHKDGVADEEELGHCLLVAQTRWSALASNL
jgi:hypothetical protein